MEKGLTSTRNFKTFKDSQPKIYNLEQLMKFTKSYYMYTNTRISRMNSVHFAETSKLCNYELCSMHPY